MIALFVFVLCHVPCIDCVHELLIIDYLVCLRPVSCDQYWLCPWIVNYWLLRRFSCVHELLIIDCFVASLVSMNVDYWLLRGFSCVHELLIIDCPVVLCHVSSIDCVNYWFSVASLWRLFILERNICVLMFDVLMFVWMKLRRTIRLLRRNFYFLVDGNFKYKWIWENVIIYIEY